LAHWQLGKPDTAVAMLQKGNELAPPIEFAPNVGSLGNDWMEWLSARIVLDEAASLIKTRENDRNPK
jgi:hypothetical protein